MKWITPLILCIVVMAGCTIKVEPLKPSRPSMHATHKKHRKPNKLERETPTPTPRPRGSKPLDLEPTDHPTPVIHLTPTAGVSPISILEALS